MNRIAPLLFPLFLLPAAVFGQGVRFDSNVTTSASNVPAGASAPILTLPGAIVTVCGYPATPAGAVCTNKVPIFSDSGLTASVGNPITSDQKGRFGFWVAPNLLSYSVQTQAGVYVGTWPLTLSSIPGPAGPSGAFTQAGFLSAAAYPSTFAAMMVDASTASSTTTISFTTPLPAGTTTVSADRDIKALGGALFTCPTGTCTLAFSGGDFTAPGDKQVFGTNVVVTGLKSVYPDWFPLQGAFTEPSVCYAINSLTANGGDVYLNDAAYRSGCDKNNPTDYNSISFLTKPNVHIHGTHRPAYNSNYTQLIGGSTIQGGFYVRTSGFHVEHVGFDVGSVVHGLYYPGYTALESLDITGALPNDPTLYPHITGIVVDDVNCLGPSTTSPDHCIIVEDADNAYIHNTQSVYHTHGMAIKGTGIVIDGIFNRGNSTEGLVVKSDSYSPTIGTSVSNVQISAIVNPGDTGGISLYGASAAMSNVNMSNISIDNASYGLLLDSDSGLTDVNLNNFNFNGETVTTAPCMERSGGGLIGQILIDNFQCVSSSGINFNTATPGLALSNGYMGSVTGDAFLFQFDALLSNIILNVVSGHAVNAASGTAYVQNLSLTSVAGSPFSGSVLYSDQTHHVNFTFANGWGNTGSPNSTGQYWTDRGMVHLAGTIWSGTAATVTTLPASLAPAANLRFAADGLTGTTFGVCEVVVTTAGVVAVTNFSTCATAYVSLDGISFSTLN
jgi:hypothetical protein